MSASDAHYADTDRRARASTAGPPVSPADRAMMEAQDALLLIARLLMAYIFIKSGFGKLTDMGAFTASLAGKGVPLANVLGVVGPCVEFFGGLAILVGVEMRAVAVLMALFVVVATLISHRYWEFSDAARRAQETNFEKNICIIGGFFVLMAAGAGRLSIDGLRRR